MLIAIAGSQGSGKSTTIKALQEQHHYNIVERKTSRSILEDWNVTLEEVNNNQELTMKFQEEILARKYHDDLLTDRDNSGIVITERTFIDLLLFCTVSIGKNNDVSEWLNCYGTRCIDNNVIYDHVFYLTAGHFNVEQDGIRGHNRFYSQLTDSGMLAFYKEYHQKDKLTIVSTPDLDARVKLISQYCNNEIKDATEIELDTYDGC